MEDCIQSILSQSSSFSYRVVFLDDGSTDHSGEILDKYKENPIIEIIHTKNGGVSKARNIALRSIAGKYVMFVDSDDVLAPNSIQVLVETAFLYNAEIIEGSYQDFDDNGTKDVHCHMGKTCAYDSFNYFGFPWGKVIRSDRLMHFCFPEGFLFEDTVMSTLLYPECRNTYTVPDVVYYYRNNPAGITNTCTTNMRFLNMASKSRYPYMQYAKKIAKYLVVLSVSAILCRISFLVVNGGILVRTLLKMVLCSLVSNAVFWIAFHRSEEFSMLRDILKRVILKLSRKAK